MPTSFAHPLAALLRVATAALLAAAAACSDLPLTGGPGPDTRKQTGPLVVPPPGVLKGTAQ